MLVYFSSWFPRLVNLSVFLEIVVFSRAICGHRHAGLDVEIIHLITIDTVSPEVTHAVNILAERCFDAL